MVANLGYRKYMLSNRSYSDFVDLLDIILLACK